MACVIRLSEPLLKLRPRKNLIETLLHEMIHAMNFIRGIMEENGGHGQNFLAKMHEINRLAGTDISVYHNFHDEVELYKKHWWRCEGPCKDRSPHYGFVKRTCNRAPSKNDRWWAQHEQTCGGVFIKVKEPEKAEKKPRGKENKKKLPITPKIESPGSDIRKFFKPDSDKGPEAKPSPATTKPSPVMSPEAGAVGGHTLGGADSGRSRLLDWYNDSKKKTESDKFTKKTKLNDGSSAVPAHCSKDVIVIDEDHPVAIRGRKSFHVSIMEQEDDDNIILLDDEFDDDFAPAATATVTDVIPPREATDEVNCPVCTEIIAIAQINEHLDQCILI